ncbi:MAG: Ig-like domain-containing protein [Prevotella sp.]|nr:Ig-like domain-containing protein [Prevotella sp.]
MNTLTVTAAGNGTNVLRLTRYSGGTTLFITALTITRESSKTASDIAIVEGKDTKTLVVDDTYTLTLGTDFTTSSTGAFTYTSEDPTIATVSSDGLITAKKAGSTTVTVSQAADATYLAGSVVFAVNVIASMARNENAVLPTDALDLSDADAASTMLNGTWHADYGHAIFGNDGSSNYITYSVVGAYQSVAEQTWVGVYSGGSTGQSWDATGVFKGSSAYNMETDRAATTKSTTAVYSFRIKGVSKVQALVSARHSTQKVVLAAFEYSGTTPAATTTLYESYGSGNDIGTMTLDLDNSKEYMITLQADGSATNSRLYEMALFYDEAVSLYETITPAKEYSTYVTKNAVDFTGLGIKAYVATAASATAVTLAEVTTVPAGTPLVLEGTASTTYNVPFIATSSAPASNLLVAGDGKTTIGGDGKYDYVLKDGLFYHASSGKVPVGKAYLHLEADPATSRGMELSLDFGGGVTGISEIEDVRSKKDDIYYDLNGRRVLYPTKGLYIVNGKKVVLK